MGAVQLPCGRSWTRGKGKEVQVGERLLLNKAVAFGKESVGFAGKADHDIRADSALRHERLKLRQPLGIVPGAIAAMHAAEHRIRAGLEGKVRMASEARSGSCR